MDQKQRIISILYLSTLLLIIGSFNYAYSSNAVFKEEPLPAAATGLSPANRMIDISGMVVDVDGEPLVGVNILVKGSSMGASTDIDGKFKISNVKADDILIVSYLGYQTKELTVGNQTYLEITLAEDSQNLGEVVVVGYGVQKKSDVTGAVSNIDEEKLQSRPVTGFNDALQGRSSGVQIRQSGGDLAGKFDIAIRGVGSVTGSNDPLIVVDGVPLFSGNFSTINPKDIASIDILKDASATAIYGSRAANGVVIITTKKGKTGKPRLQLSIDHGFENISNRYDVMSTEEQRLLFVEAFKNSSRSIDVYNDPDNPAWAVDTDWQELGTQTGTRQNYNLSISGGNESTQYAFSGGYLNRKGTILNTDLQSYSLRANVSSRVNNWLKISSNLSGSQQNQNYINNDGFFASGYRGYAFQHSYTPAYDENGELTAVNTTAAPYFGANDNPLIGVLLPTREREITRILGNLKIDIDLTKELALSGNLGADLVQNKGYSYSPVYSIGRFNNPQGTVTSTNNNDINWVSDLTLTYKKKFENHDINVLLGGSLQQYKFTNTRVEGKGTIDNSLNQLSNQTSFDASGGEVNGGLVSTFARVNYGYKSRYLLTATVRRDGSSKFGPQKRYGVFPSGSVAWRVSEENFLADNNVIDDLKFRISYGLTGNQNIGNFAFITRAGASPYVFGNSVVVGNSPVNIGNPDLQWETNKQFDVGVDISLFSGRINSTIDFYDKKSEDLLIETPIPITAGVQTPPIVNIGSVQNKGVELSINSVNTTNRLKWSTSFNISFNKNKVLDIGSNSVGNPLEIPGENIPLSNTPSNLTLAGYPVGAFYMYEFEGVWQLGEEDAAKKWSGAVPGDPKYKDNNNNGILDAGDKSFVGTPHPKYFGGLDNTFQYKDFTLSILFNFAGGNKLYNTARNLFSRGVPFVQNFKEVNGFWTPDNPSNTVPRPSQGGNTTTLTTLVSDRFLEDASFVRLKNISLSYDLRNSAFKKMGLENVKITASAINLATFTKYSGLDPEVSSRTSLLSAGIDYTAYPNTRQYNLGLIVNF